MPTGLLFDCDEQMAKMLFRINGQPDMKFDKCLGLINNETSVVVGFVLFHHWNGFNVELSYYGAGTMTPGIIRCLARFIICTFDASRLTVTISKRNRPLLRSVVRFGFKLEGVQRCYYGRRDCARNTGVRFAMFRDRLEQLAALEAPKAAEAKKC